MDSANLLEDTPVKPTFKKPRTRKNKVPDPSTDKRRKENRQPSEKQLAAQFKQGNPGSGHAPKTMRDLQKRYRAGMATLSAAVVPEMLCNLIYKAYEEGDTKTFLELSKYATEQAFGRAREWTDYEQEQPLTNNLPTINIMNVNGEYAMEQKKLDQQITFEGEYTTEDSDDELGDDDDV